MLVASFNEKGTTLQAVLARGGTTAGGKKEIYFVDELPDLATAKTEVLYYLPQQGRLYAAAADRAFWIPINIPADEDTITSASGTMAVNKVSVNKVQGLNEKLAALEFDTLSNTELDALLT